ncbi:GNAT family N-acetyltransferase [Actinorugispora endophytica]|uniref:Acetyltransferase (GNAT) family protein n=1 Tax=Actinorugispora endophytica TaxID=1605990 RepID=A0A4R6V2P5_9ACTN|nr:GNAT family N-acetyltransferase [Actinorugispora endophytica]TDQ52923.1 acetyltransferase (GNAT) family protein [Actinorugispora endophytica]
MAEIVRLSSEDLAAVAAELAGVLSDVVEGGNSVGFLAPLDPGAAEEWWKGLEPAVAGGRVLVWAARRDGRIEGTVQLRLNDMPNGSHRAEVAKLMVRRRARGAGLGRALLAAAERAAGEAGVTLLVLDTETGSPAERLYRADGWTRVGVIPDYAADPAGVLRSTTYFYKLLA